MAAWHLDMVVDSSMHIALCRISASHRKHHVAEEAFLDEVALGSLVLFLVRA